MFKNRRKALVDILRKGYPEVKNGIILLFADFENVRSVFRQESSFYSLTCVTEPSVVLAIYFDENKSEEILYLPNYGGVREKWLATFLTTDKKTADKIKVDQVKNLGGVCGGYTFTPKFTKEKYSNLISDLNSKIDDQTVIFTLLDENENQYFYQNLIYKNLCQTVSHLRNNTINIAPIIHEMRTIKSKYEVDRIYNAIQITSLAQESACGIIKSGSTENEIKAIIEAVFTNMGAQIAFPSIVATGKNTTVLHYMGQNETLKNGDLVLIDIGAEYKYYAADLTRTYPVSGKFTKRQAEVYNIVLQTQSFIEQAAQPGMFLNNPDNPDKSLQHLALKFLKSKGYDKYFFHGIGHHLGLDVHDVGSLKEPLLPGAVFTIEPGIYIPEENMGIRIEDDFLMTDEGAVCLSYQLPKTIEEIEALFKK